MKHVEGNGLHPYLAASSQLAVPSGTEASAAYLPPHEKRRLELLPVASVWWPLGGGQKVNVRTCRCLLPRLPARRGSTRRTEQCLLPGILRQRALALTHNS
eukprot:scaffold388_cov380-Prasinococcus_capsulatus_cf.AAC.5